MKNNDTRHTKTTPSFWMRLLLLIAMVNGSFGPAAWLFNEGSTAKAQVTIGGNVYGGGNEGDVEGNTRVTIRTCEISGDVFGGARMADVGGSAFVNIDGEHASGEIMIRTIYGGNDIAGTVGTKIDPADTGVDKIPTELTEVKRTGVSDTETSKKNEINNTWCAFVRTSPTTTEDKTHRIIVGSIFGGGNGDYTYTAGSETGKYNITIDGKTYTDIVKPTLSKTYLELTGGCLAHIYGGGNNATVTGNTTICINNTSKGLIHVIDADNPQAEFAKLARFVNLSTFQGDYSSLDFTASRVFGGNNKAAMNIHPNWNLQRGRIRDLYSGGNEGNMIHPEGIFLEVKPLPANNEALVINNVYGGCRRADVVPTDPTTGQPLDMVLPLSVPGYSFPAGLSARTAIQGGHITNVYGGNDISGRVFGGNALGIHTTIYGDVYGGGNGSYSYTDNATLGAIPAFADYYYNPTEVRDKERQYSGNDSFNFTTGYESVEALNIFRPNAEQVSLLVVGDKDNPTIVRGSIYVGGNSATLKPKSTESKAELKIGSYVICDNVFLGNNGANMVTEDILKLYAQYVNTSSGATEATGTAANDYSQMNLTDQTTFAKYMEGCAMASRPSVVFDNTSGQEYKDFTAQFGSFYCGGNVGSMTWPGKNTLDFNKKVIIYNKFVGGCNRANVAATDYNAKYLGGMIGSAEEQAPGGMENDDGSIKDCLIINLSGLKIRPKRWKDPTDITKGLEWNTYDESGNPESLTAAQLAFTGEITRTDNAADFNRRLRGGNIYGGCYESGHINGNVVINLLNDIIDKDSVFDIVTKESEILYENNKYTVTKRNSGVILDEQGMDPLGLALNVFGGGYGKDSKIWGSATVNLKDGYTFQIFGGGQEGPVGKSREDIAYEANTTVTYETSDYVFNGEHYTYDARYSTYVNLNDLDQIAGTATADIPETEFIYGGSFEAPIMGNTRINLGCGRIFNSFAGSCNADILGHTETYVGLNSNDDTDLGFPWIRDHIYGGNDLGGQVMGEIRAALFPKAQYPNATDAEEALKDCNFSSRVRSDILPNVYRSDTTTVASAYIEYRQGRVDNIFGGCYGDYDYVTEYRDIEQKPYMYNAFVNIRPENNANNRISEIYGAGQGQHLGDSIMNEMQERSYVLIDIPQNRTEFVNTAVFGAGAFSGLGMKKTYAETTNANFRPLLVSAVIDLFRGQIKNAYGGSYQEGVTRRTVVNVPTGSTVTANNIFGGAYGVDNRFPCDVIETHVNYSSEGATISGGIFGGNNNCRRSLFTNVNINAKVWSNRQSGYTGYAYGAGLGKDTWAEYTEVNINNGGDLYKCYGGGSAGKVLNIESVTAWNNSLATADKMNLNLSRNKSGYGTHADGMVSPMAKLSALALDYKAGEIHTDYDNHSEYNIDRKYNTNVHIREGGYVSGYCYGGGYGVDAIVSGFTYIDVLGGTVNRDVYAAGESGPVRNLYEAKGSTTFLAAANAYIKGGTVRNVYGGGWRGDVGYHEKWSKHETTDIPGWANVVIGNKKANATYLDGDPAIMRNAYGGGEGGSIYGTANITVNNGHIGYRYKNTAAANATPAYEYVEELDDAAAGDNLLDESGNVFGGGYIANSYTDESYVTMYGGIVRGSLYGGGEIGPIGRGTANADSITVLNGISAYAPYKRLSSDAQNAPAMAYIFKGGAAHVMMYEGHVLRDVFGGGRGYDNWGGDGTKFYTNEEIALMDLGSKGYVFGRTDVHIRGGEIGTYQGVAKGYGNVFGGGNVGFVYSSTGTKKGSDPYTIDHATGFPSDGGGYYYYGNDINKGMTLDCSVVVEPYCRVTADGGVGSKTYIDYEEGTDANGRLIYQEVNKTQGFAKGEYVPTGYLNTLKNRHSTDTNGEAEWNKLDATGVIIHNAIFAGGNVMVGSDQMFVNTATVLGNVTAVVRDIFNRDLVTIGTNRIGGIYGDGNLTFVDGFRELHIDNYGSDYWNLQTEGEITKEYYDGLNDREKAYFKVTLVCKVTCTDKNGITYNPGDVLTMEEFGALFVYDSTKPDSENIILANGEFNPAYWEEKGYNIYDGRILNTIQRADFCGVYGSRMVLFGARDRVPEKADFTEYTLNRVTEVSLNQRLTQAGDVDPLGNNMIHGNYFGIYNVVNYFGNLTSDVKFTDVRTTNTSNTSIQADGHTSYFAYKNANPTSRYRNNATSQNKVALASGVYLQLINETTEKRTDGATDWGYITGVVELDLIDVKTGMGGGYVYAKNQHGVRYWHGDPSITSGDYAYWDKVTLSPFNLTANTFRRFHYDETVSTLNDIQTSGNFVHNVKQIVDDCYPKHNAYGQISGETASPAHYWYIKGSIYVYDQYISAYTGSANAYAEAVTIPLSISAASHGKLLLREVKPNKFAYFDRALKPIGQEVEEIEVNNKVYKLGDPIDWWNWNILSSSEQHMFVDSVYTTIAACKIGNDSIPKGTVILPARYRELKSANAQVYYYDEKKNVDFDFIFREANNVSHDTGYALTFDMTNPTVWDKYYTNEKARNSVSTETYNAKVNGSYTLANRDDYIPGPTYSPYESGVYGQRTYTEGEILSGKVKDAYPTSHVTGRTDQADVEAAYIVTTDLTAQYTKDGHTYDEVLNAGTPIYRSKYTDAQWAAISSKVSAAKLCTSTIELTGTEFVYANALLSDTEVNDLKTRLAELHTDWTSTEINDYVNSYLVNAYYCTKEGLYGGSYFERGKSYPVLDTWNIMSETDRAKFVFNYDALDLLVDPEYGGSYGYKPQYDGYVAWQTGQPGAPAPTATYYVYPNSSAQNYFDAGVNNPKLYSVEKPIDYMAEFKPTNDQITALGSHYVSDDGDTDYLKYTDESNTVKKVYVGFENRIKREVYEEIPNERSHWAPITVTKPGDYYVVKEEFTAGDIPYTAGEVISSEVYANLGTFQANIQKINFPDDTRYTQRKTGEDLDYTLDKNWVENTYYFCRESYTIGEKGEGRGFTNLGLNPETGQTTTQQQYTSGTVPQYLLIDQTNYDGLINLQTGFQIHGEVPNETSTLYVTRESNFYDLQKEKIITVVYLYNYQESDENGHNITPMSERHVVNIHLQFKTGVPEIGKIEAPPTVLPGTSVGMKIPTVTPGAFEITNSGWEIFSSSDDATVHRNGKPFVNNTTPLYWYQNNYYVAYYTQTYLGKTYSNSVPFSVANYHNIADIMSYGNRHHHMYIDHEDVDRAPKIYIDNRASSVEGKSKLDQLKDLFDLSLLTSSVGVDEETDTIKNASSPFKGHKLLDTRVKAGKNLVFFLRSNVSPQYYTASGGSATPWTPIGDTSNCFEGTMHGDGYTVTGIDNSLFGKLCGNVYNLGVTGSFTSAGVADTGDGYVENCWVMSSATVDSNVKAVFGDPSDGTGTQVVNCYYPASNAYSETSHARGNARKMPNEAFYNGEVSYDLNGFYLQKRYFDHTLTTAAGNKSYSFFRANADGTLPDTPETKYYNTDYAIYPLVGTKLYGYVEDRFADGDFIYAGGSIPTGNDVRLYTDTQTGEHYYPIWPDDYLFFGQKLTYGHVDGMTHQDLPTNISKSSTRLVRDNSSNRVYRAPAYYRSHEMSMAHYNPYAIFAQKSADQLHNVTPNMTAIDFTGYNDTHGPNITDGAYKQGLQGSLFFPPMLDNDGLTLLRNIDLTQNWLVYTPAADSQNLNSAESMTNDAVTDYLIDPVYAETNATTYRTVAAQDVNSIHGHAVVEVSAGTYQSLSDQLLVDKNDFNAPIAYTLAAGKRMWYQRVPDTYVDMTKGWEGISIPFSAELVTTNQKGEITHFYSGSASIDNDTHTKIGHEYWLREFEGIKAHNTTEHVDTAAFNYPTAQPTWYAGTSYEDKSYGNTFLWDYYYSKSAGKDANTDIYQQQYYQQGKSYEDYAYLATAKPYIIGFPGATYYEFDLSGTFKATHTINDDAITQLNRQTITFASAASTSEKPIAIAVSDTECANAAVTYNDYTFHPNYLGKEVAVGAFHLAADGSSYDVTTAETAGVPFRPYFTVAASSPAKGDASKNAAQHITFSRTRSALGGDEEMQPDITDMSDGELKINTKRGRIIVTSYFNNNTTVQIISASGKLFRTFDIAPGESVETTVGPGIFIVNKKKVSVK